MGEKIKFKNSSSIKKNDYKWVITIVISSFVLSITMNALSTGIMPAVNIFVALAILFTLIFIGVFFDIIGIAVTAATETPFHSMAARKVKAAKQALYLIRNAEKVANFCNDVVGDIAGIISGSAIAIIVSQLVLKYGLEGMLPSLIMTGIVASITVGGKALGKGFAMRKANSIVYSSAKIFYYLDKLRGKEDV